MCEPKTCCGKFRDGHLVRRLWKISRWSSCPEDRMSEPERMLAHVTKSEHALTCAANLRSEIQPSNYLQNNYPGTRRDTCGEAV